MYISHKEIKAGRFTYRDLLEKLSIDLYYIKDRCRVIGHSNDLNESIQNLEEVCKNNEILHDEWSLLGGRLKMFSLKKKLPGTFSKATQKCAHLLDPSYVNFVRDNADELNKYINEEKDWKYHNLAVISLSKIYFLKVRDEHEGTFVMKPMETPQYMFMRIAVHLWKPVSDKNDERKSALEKIRETYNLLSNNAYMHGSATLINAGRIKSQMASCFLLHMGDSIEHIVKLWNNCALLSKYGGGLGVSIYAARHSEIGGDGESKGILPWIKILGEIVKGVNQLGKRKGACAVFCSDWHLDIEMFLDMKIPTMPEEQRARDLFYGLIVCDEFMRRVAEDKDWTLFCPNKAKGLIDVWGEEFEKLYYKYEQDAREGKITHFKIIKAKSLWEKILYTQQKTSGPYMIYIDAVNRKTNHQNLGKIKSSNLCCEIMEYTDENIVASCNLANINLSNFVGKHGDFEYKDLEECTRCVVRNMNQVIERNYYCDGVVDLKKQNIDTAPLGIGVQGLADTFALMDIIWGDNESYKVNKRIFETMYYAAVTESAKIAQERGYSYAKFEGSPMSKGILQFDMWNEEEVQMKIKEELKNGKVLSEKEVDALRLKISDGHNTGEYDWKEVREEVKKGVANSLLLALMPTANNAHICGNNECFEPFTQLISPRTLSVGQFAIPNKYLIRDMTKINLWNDHTVRQLIKCGDNLDEVKFADISSHLSVASRKHASEQFAHLQLKYKTAFKIPQKILLQMALDRGRYVCQSQSLNCFMEKVDLAKLSAYHFYGWKNGAKTGMYYFRQKAIANAINFAVDSSSEEVCSKESDCLYCT
ncbi:MAG TPA: ribonucleoside-diphosphate reductase subunit alpha [Nitrosarchaeum sp.]|nr:ribonucleoside-diphosphate reductase subunit alpha [Nitrosarchaeum sp.]